MRDEKGNITIKSVYKWLRSDTGKRYSFFIFYFFFFLILYLAFSFNQNSNNQLKPTEEQEETTLSLPFNTKNLEDNSYKFNYTITKNDEVDEYLGEKNKLQITLTNDSKTYLFSYQNGKLINNETDSFNVNFLDLYELKRIIKNATLTKEVKFTSTDEYEYTYEIKTSELATLFSLDYENTDVNQITVTTDSTKNIKKITLNLLNFMNEEIINNEDNRDTDKLTTYLITITYGEI